MFKPGQRVKFKGPDGRLCEVERVYPDGLVLLRNVPEGTPNYGWVGELEEVRND